MKPETSQRNAMSWARVLLLSALFGLLTGLIESPLLGVQKLLSARALYLGPRVIWMAPIADLLLFAAIGLLLLLLSWRWHRWRSSRVVLTVFCFLASLSWLLIFSRIQWYASVLLATGIAVQAGRFLAPRLTPSYLFLVVGQPGKVTVRYGERERPRAPSDASRGILRSLTLPVLFPLVEPLPFLNRAIKITVAITIALVVSVEGRLWWAEHHALSTLPPAAEGAPNVLLIVMDTVRAQSMSLYGYPRETTPQLARFAGRGMQFDWAISTAPWTTPSHAGLFTGHYPFECSTDWDKPLDRHYPTLAEILKGHGYATAGFVANTFGCGYETGLDRGFAHYEDYSITPGEVLISSSLIRAVVHSDPLRHLLGNHQVVTRKSAADINRDFLAWQRRQTSHPFFAFLNYLDAHEPYLPPPPFDRKFGTSPHVDQYQARHDLRISFRYGRDQLSAAETQAEMDAYDGAIAYLDQQIGLLLDELERRGTLENTLVVITSDHGESFGEHKDYGHGNSLYMSLLHVPLLIFYPPRVPAHQHIAESISLRDLPATIYDLAGISGPAQFPGYSLACHWIPDRPPGTPDSSPVLSEVNVGPIRPGKYPTGKPAQMCSVLQEPLHYIKNANGREELYDIVKDPAEQTNLQDEVEAHHLMDTLKCVTEKVN